MLGMTTFEKLRALHAGLIAGSVTAYLTGEMGLVHAWIGYGVAALIAVRIVWGLFGPRQIGIARHLPTLADFTTMSWGHHPLISKLLLGAIVSCLLVVTGTGVAMDRFAAFSTQQMAAAGGSGSVWTVTPRGAPAAGRASQAFVSSALADDHNGTKRQRGGTRWVKKVHEASADLLFLFVALHIGYLLTFKRKLAMYMLYLQKPAKHSTTPGAGH